MASITLTPAEPTKDFADLDFTALSGLSTDALKIPNDGRVQVILMANTTLTGNVGIDIGTFLRIGTLSIESRDNTLTHTASGIKLWFLGPLDPDLYNNADEELSMTMSFSETADPAKMFAAAVRGGR